MRVDGGFAGQGARETLGSVGRGRPVCGDLIAVSNGEEYRLGRGLVDRFLFPMPPIQLSSSGRSDGSAVGAGAEVSLGSEDGAGSDPRVRAATMASCRTGTSMYPLSCKIALYPIAEDDSTSAANLVQV